MPAYTFKHEETGEVVTHDVPVCEQDELTVKMESLGFYKDD